LPQLPTTQKIVLATFEDINIEDEFEEEKKVDDRREARLKAQRDAMHRKKQEER